MRYVAFLFAFVCLIAPLAGPAPAIAQVLLNEILADPGQDWNGDGEIGSRSDEWIEVKNTGTVAVDLSHLRLGDASGGLTWRFAFSGTLSPGQVLVVFGSDASAWQASTGFPSAGLSLNNGGDTVTLYSVAGGDTLVVDAYGYGSSAVLDDRAVGRTIDGAEWVVFDALNPYTGSTPPLGTGCAPSPGMPNTCDPVLPVKDTTWGAVKHQYQR